MIDGLPDSLQRYARKIFEASAPCVRISVPNEGGASHFGGSALLPSGETWPLAQSGRPLDHLISIDLSEVPRIEANALPSSGTLLFFYDTEGQPWGIPGQEEDWRVLYRLEGDAGTAAVGPSFPEEPVGMTFSVATSYDGDLDLNLSEEENDAYFDWLGGDHPFQMFGHESEVQGPLEDYVPGHRLLLQLPSDDGLGTMWGDVGNLYFTMTPADMAQGRFDKVKLNLQCY
ncbi:hypothetical protein BH11ARM2_BH11ARM2_33340 [soil metagenome]